MCKIALPTQNVRQYNGFGPPTPKMSDSTSKIHDFHKKTYLFSRGHRFSEKKKKKPLRAWVRDFLALKVGKSHHIHKKNIHFFKGASFF